MSNWATHLKHLKAHLGHPPSARPFGKGVRFSPESDVEYRTPPDAIEAELRDLGYEPEAVRAIRASKGRPGCIFFGQFKYSENLTPSIYNVTELLCMPGVTVEAGKGKTGPAQCHRCQAFRHSSHNCHRPLVCVRCGGPHFAGECPRPREAPPTCINCDGAHTQIIRTALPSRKRREIKGQARLPLQPLP